MALYRLNYNWIMGQARVTSVSVQELYRRDQSAFESAGGEVDMDNGESKRMQEYGRAPIVRFRGSVILVVSPGGLVHLWRIKAPPTLDRIASGWGQPEFWQTYRCSRPTMKTQITCLALDTSARRSSKDWQMAVVGYDSGHFSVFEYSQQQDSVNDQTLNGGDPSSAIHDDKDVERATLRELGNTADLPVWSDVAPIQTVSFHYPILTTCAEDGTISIYLIETESTDSLSHWCRLLHRLYGTSTGSPIEIALERITPVSNMSSACGAGGHWRALVSFGLELYDSSWTVRLQEIEFDEHYILYSAEIGTDGDNAGQDSEHMDTDEAYDSPFPTYFKSPMSGSEPSSCTRSLGHARIGSISAISISWPFVVTTHSDNTMNVFQMTRNADWDIGGTHALDGRRFYQPLNVYKGRLHFQHLSTLYGHCGAVSSVSIESRSGRLVSASMDRSIKVWSMTMEIHEDQLEQQRVHRCSVSMSDINKSWTEGGQVTKEEGLGLIWVGSDEEKIVSLSCDGTVKVWQFS
ncbi:hypothetical protein BGZ58_007107 [Dissophora ornata]|nr:hypothetical protein BGZ58_007107 [Dissophora ornata]